MPIAKKNGITNNTGRNISRLLSKLPPGTSNLNYYSFGTYPMLRAFLNKDIKSTFRKTQNLSYIFLPVLFVIPFFFAIGTTSGLDSAFFSLLMQAYLTINLQELL